jgi:hypothetical protein
MPARLLILAALAVAVGACSNGTSKPSAGAPRSDSVPPGAAGTTTPLSKFSNLYLQILGPADAATGKFFAALKSLPSTATAADAQKIATPAADAIEAADRRLSTVSWPGKVGRDVHTLVLADARLVNDLRNLAPQNRITYATWKKQFESDVAKVTNSASLVRTDLATTSK